ncbi:MAG: hypothetical protein ABIJ97_12505 [Bacteroidota bacterium]
MKDFWKKNKNGLIGTIVFHGLLMLVLLFFGFTEPQEQFPDPEGIVIDFGNSDQGLGDIEPESFNNENAVQNNSNPENTEESIMTQDFEESANIEKTTNLNQENTNPEVNNEEKVTEPEVNKNALYQGNNNATSEGNNNDGGNMGRPDGLDTDNYTDGNGKDGIGYSLTGRTPVGKFPKPDYPPGNVSGKVVLNIKVDKYGKVISVTPGKGTTATDERLIVAAKKAAWQVKFNEDFNSIEQTGTITYIFSFQ